MTILKTLMMEIPLVLYALWTLSTWTMLLCTWQLMAWGLMILLIRSLTVRYSIYILILQLSKLITWNARNVYLYLQLKLPLTNRFSWDGLSMYIWQTKLMIYDISYTFRIYMEWPQILSSLQQFLQENIHIRICVIC